MQIKLRKRYQSHKFFGYADEKWARGSGKHGYARSYGHYSNYGFGRTKTELLMESEFDLINEELNEWNINI